jgi:arsenical pump membrane protein
VAEPSLPAGGRIAAFALVATAGCLLAASYRGLDLGWPTLLCGMAATVLVTLMTRENPLGLVREIYWGILPLTAGLFVFVEALAHTGVIAVLVGGLRSLAGPQQAAWLGGSAVALAANLANNLPVGLVTGSAITGAHVPPAVAGALLVGVDLGPNLSVTGSLATILWLASLRREGIDVSGWTFLKIGVAVMVPALLAALALLATLRL